MLALPAVWLNAWSVAYLWGNSLASAPAWHGSALRWQVQDALARGEIGAALQHETALAAKTDARSRQTLAWLHFAQGRHHQALVIWVEQDDVRSLLTAGRQVHGQSQDQVAYRFHAAAWQIDPVRATTPLAEFLLATGDTRSAKQTLEYALFNWPHIQQRSAWQRMLDEIQVTP